MTTDRPNGLAAADSSARQQSTQDLNGDPAVGCPLLATHRIELSVVGEDDEPLEGVAVEIRKQPALALRSRTDTGGRARFTGVERGSYELCLSDLDAAAWEVLRSEPLPLAQAKTAGVAPWETLGATPEDAPIEHVANPGDCIAQLAERHGLLPDTIWDLAANAELKRRRKSKNILAPGDEVTIPARRERTLTVETGRLYRLRRKGVPETLRVRFLDYHEDPRVGVPYLVKIQTASGQVVPHRKGETDSGGYLAEAIPADAVAGEIILAPDDAQERYRFELGHLDPVEETCGLQSRLNNLGFPCGEVDGELGSRTRSALARFQRATRLPITGESDADTRAKLSEKNLS